MWHLGSLLHPATRILAVTLATTLATAVADWLVILPLAIVRYGATSGLRAGLVDGLVTGLPVGVAFGLIFALAGGFALGLVTLLETPLDTGAAATPVSLLVANRATVLRQILVTAPVLAVVIGVGGWVVVALLQGLVGPLSWPLPDGIIVGVVGGVSIALSYALAFTAWGQWMVLSRVTLPLAGRLPWALTTFLDDAYQRGVLRQAGAVYQFRHARLQRHLSQACWPSATGPS